MKQILPNLKHFLLAWHFIGIVEEINYLQEEVKFFFLDLHLFFQDHYIEVKITSTTLVYNTLK